MDKKIKRNKKEDKNRYHKAFEFFRKIIPLFIGFVLTVFSIFFILRLLTFGQKLPQSISGFDILHDCADEPKMFVALIPIFGTQHIRVVAHIENWREISSDFNEYNIFFPGFTSDYAYLLNVDGLPEKTVLPQKDLKKLSRESTRRKFTENIDVIWDPNFYQSIIRFNPSKIKGFSGGIEFTWLNGLRVVSYSKTAILLPFQTPLPSEIHLNKIKNYTLQVFAPKGYDMASTSPKPERFQLIGGRSLYHFEINVNKTDFFITFENELLSRKRDYLLIIFSTILGIGLALIVAEIISFVKPQ